MSTPEAPNGPDPQAAPAGASGRALVVGPYLRRPGGTSGRAAAAGGGEGRSAAARLEEAVGLALAIDLEIAGAVTVMLSVLTPATYIGTGKVAEIADLVREHNAKLVIVDGALSPVQQRNLEKAWDAKVVDRTGLILEIFGERARTREGTLQVEHAHLSYQKGRLVRSWTHLERQRGGFGFLGGPGETQLETDRRLIEDRLARIERDLETVKRTRELHRRSRRRVPYPIVALVGYTNAGKSTLFNRLTGSDVFQADLLFATLDPTLRAVRLPDGARIIVSDTVGFISDLPTMLIAAFRATLEEVIEADIILHVRDISHPDTAAQAADVAAVLRELGIDPEAGGRVIELWNKADRLASDEREHFERLAARQPEDRPAVLISALTGEGLLAVARAIEARLAHSRALFEVTIAAENGEGLSWLYRNAEVLEREDRPEGSTRLRIRVDPSKAGLVAKRFSGARQDQNGPAGGDSG